MNTNETPEQKFERVSRECTDVIRAYQRGEVSVVEYQAALDRDVAAWNELAAAYPEDALDVCA